MVEPPPKRTTMKYMWAFFSSEILQNKRKLNWHSHSKYLWQQYNIYSMIDLCVCWDFIVRDCRVYVSMKSIMRFCIVGLQWHFSTIDNPDGTLGSTPEGPRRLLHFVQYVPSLQDDTEYRVL